MPGGDVGQGEVPGGPAGDVGVAADGDEGVAGVEDAVALVEEAEVAGGVAGGGDAAEGAVEFAIGDEVRGLGAGAGEGAFDL